MKQYFFGMVRAGGVTSALALIVGGLLITGTLGSTNAALWFEIRTNPQQPHAGELVIIQVRTLRLAPGLDCLDDVRAVGTPYAAYTEDSQESYAILDRFELEIVSPEGDRNLVILEREREDQSKWIGSFTFSSAGTWFAHLTMPSATNAGMTGPDTCSGASIEIDVKSPPGAATPASVAGTPVTSAHR